MVGSATRGRGVMAMLACLGLGYCAQHYVSECGGRFAPIIGTSRTAERTAELATRDFGGRRLEMLMFDGTTASRGLLAVVGQANALLISAAPAGRGDPVLAALHEELAAAPGLVTGGAPSTHAVY